MTQDFIIEDAEVSCKKVALNPCGSDEYEVVIITEGLFYRIHTLSGPLEPNKDMCQRVYSEWKTDTTTTLTPKVTLTPKLFEDEAKILSRVCSHRVFAGEHH